MHESSLITSLDLFSHLLIFILFFFFNVFHVNHACLFVFIPVYLFYLFIYFSVFHCLVK